MNEGQLVGQRIEKFCGLLEEKIDEATRRVTVVESESEQILARRGEALESLAELYLPEMSRAAVEQGFAGVRDELLAILSRKERRQAELEELLTKSTAALSQYEQDLHDVTGRWQERSNRLAELEAEVATQLEAHPDFSRLSHAAAQAEERLTQNERRIEAVERQAKEKLPAYEESRLFQYLYDRHYGTPEYNHRGLTRRLDRWVSRLIDYRASRHGYDFLRSMPELMKVEVERRREEFDALMQQAEDLEAQVESTTGLTTVRTEHDALERERGEILTMLEKHRSVERSLREERAQFQEQRGQFYAEAVQRLREFLAKAEEATLRQKAESTPERQDDLLVAEVSSLQKDLEEHRQERENRVLDSERFRQAFEDLHEILRRFRQRNYDSPTSFFAGGFNIADRLQKFVEGQLSDEELWREIARAQQLKPPFGEDAERFGRMLDAAIRSGTSRVLVRAMGNAVGSALRGNVVRGVTRRRPQIFK